jgi:hypothetical protein
LGEVKFDEELAVILFRRQLQFIIELLEDGMGCTLGVLVQSFNLSSVDEICQINLPTTQVKWGK